MSRRWMATRRALRGGPSPTVQPLPVTSIATLFGVLQSLVGVGKCLSGSAQERRLSICERQLGGQQSNRKNRGGNAQQGGGHGSVERSSRVWKARYASGLLAMPPLRGSSNVVHNYDSYGRVSFPTCFTGGA